jgi:hypothetical protein
MSTSFLVSWEIVKLGKSKGGKECARETGLLPSFETGKLCERQAGKSARSEGAKLENWQSAKLASFPSWLLVYEPIPVLVE